MTPLTTMACSPLDPHLVCVGCTDGTARLVNISARKAVYRVDHNDESGLAPQEVVEKLPVGGGGSSLGKAAGGGGKAEGGEEGDEEEEEEDEEEEEETSASVERCVTTSSRAPVLLTPPLVGVECTHHLSLPPHQHLIL